MRWIARFDPAQEDTENADSYPPAIQIPQTAASSTGGPDTSSDEFLGYMETHPDIRVSRVNLDLPDLPKKQGEVARESLSNQIFFFAPVASRKPELARWHDQVSHFFFALSCRTLLMDLPLRDLMR
jgi:hypothetical protein